MMASITPGLGYDVLSDVDLVIEAVFESMEVKQQVFSALDTHCKPGAIAVTRPWCRRAFLMRTNR